MRKFSLVFMMAIMAATMLVFATGLTASADWIPCC